MSNQSRQTPLDPPRVGARAFDARYFRCCCGEPYERNENWLALFARIAGRIVSDIGPTRVLDAGCAMGFLVETLRDRGVDAYGIDVSPYAIAHVHDPIRPYCRCGSITEELDEQFDLIVSIEVLEHMPADEAQAAIENLCRHTKDILFSSSPQGYKEATHVNVHQPDYWAEQFGRHGFFRDVDFDGSFITPWTIRFRRRTDPVHRVVRDYERRLWELLAERNDLRDRLLQLQEQIAEKPERRSFASRVKGRITRALGVASR